MKNYHVTFFLAVALIWCNHSAQVFLSKNGVLHLPNMFWKSASLKQIFQSGIFNELDSVKNMWRHGVSMSYSVTGDVYFLLKKPDLMGTWKCNFGKLLLTWHVFRRKSWTAPSFLRFVKECICMHLGHGCIPRSLGKRLWNSFRNVRIWP